MKQSLFGWQRAIGALPLVAFRGLAGGLPILIGLYIGHAWGLVSLGAYTYASSLTAVGLVVSDWGCARWLPRELTLVRQGGAKLDTVFVANTIRFCVACGFTAFTFALYALHMIDMTTLSYASELSILYFIAIVSTNAVSDCVAAGELTTVGYAVCAGLAVFAAGVVVVHRASAGPHALVAAYVAGKLVEAIALVSGRMRLVRFVAARAMSVATRLWPFSIQAILAVIYARLSVFVIERLQSMSAVGIIGAASALQNVVLLLPTSLALLVYPRLVNASNAAERGRLLRGYLGIALVAVAIATAAIAAVRIRIAAALHVPIEYANFLVVVVALAAFSSVTIILGILLQATNRERSVARLSFVTLGLAIAYQYLLIRRWGVWGSAFALMAAEITSLLLFGFAVYRSGRTVS